MNVQYLLLTERASRTEIGQVKSWGPDWGRRCSAQGCRTWAESHVAAAGSCGVCGLVPGSANPKGAKWKGGTRARSQASGASRGGRGIWRHRTSGKNYLRWLWVLSGTKGVLVCDTTRQSPRWPRAVPHPGAEPEMVPLTTHPQRHREPRRNLSTLWLNIEMPSLSCHTGPQLLFEYSSGSGPLQGSCHTIKIQFLTKSFALSCVTFPL